VAAVGRGLALLLLGRDRPETGLVDWLGMTVVGITAGVVAGARSVSLTVRPVPRDAVEPRTEQHGKQEADQRQRRDERDELLGSQRATP
jgi:hypothetical protein